MPNSKQIIPLSWFLQDENGLASRFAQGVHLEDAKTGTHAFTILGRIVTDLRLEIERPETELMIYKNTMDKHGDAIRQYADQWDLTGDLHKKVEELLWTNVLMYGVGGSVKSGSFNADFIL